MKKYKGDIESKKQQLKSRKLKLINEIMDLRFKKSEANKAIDDRMNYKKSDMENVSSVELFKIVYDCNHEISRKRDEVDELNLEIREIERYQSKHPNTNS